MSFGLLCANLVVLLIGLGIVFGGYRLFLAFLPIWGFFFGFALGGQALQALFGVGFLASVTSLVAGFLVGTAFAVFSYLFYIVGIGLLAASLGYGLGVGLMHLIGIDLGVLVFLVGVVLAIVVAGITLYFNIQKYVVILASALGGTAVIVGTFVYGFGNYPPAAVVANPVRLALQDSALWSLFFLIFAAAGVIFQVMTTRDFEVEPYPNRV